MGGLYEIRKGIFEIVGHGSDFRLEFCLINSEIGISSLLRFYYSMAKVCILEEEVI